jgi:hypothetical protein
MSTRCNVILTDEVNDPTKEQLLDACKGTLKGFLVLYHHSDGYPSNIMPMLKKFVSWIGTRIRDNASQSIGWLILMEKEGGDEPIGDDINVYGWKASQFEPTTCIHEDIEYLYVVNMVKKTIKVYFPLRDENYNIRGFKKELPHARTT